MASKADDFIKSFTDLPDGEFDPYDLTAQVRGHSCNENQVHILCDVIDALWDCVNMLLEKYEGDKM